MSGQRVSARGGVGGLTLTGHKSLIRLLNRLPDNLYRQVISGANKKAMAPVLADAKQRAPVETGALRDSLDIKTKLYPKKGVVWTGVGPRKDHSVKVASGGGKSGVRAPIKYAHLVEEGHRIARKGTTLERKDEDVRKTAARAAAHGKVIAKETGTVPAKPFIRPAWNGQKPTILALWIGHVRRGLARIVKRKGGISKFERSLRRGARSSAKGIGRIGKRARRMATKASRRGIKASRRGMKIGGRNLRRGLKQGRSALRRGSKAGRKSLRRGMKGARRMGKRSAKFLRRLRRRLR